MNFLNIKTISIITEKYLILKKIISFPTSSICETPIGKDNAARLFVVLKVSGGNRLDFN